MNLLKRHLPSPAMIVALVALFVALGGAAYAGVTLSNNSVKSATIKNGEVKTADLANSAVTNLKLKNNAVNSAKVKNGSLEAADLSAAAQAALKGTGRRATRGPPDLAGARKGTTRAVNVRDGHRRAAGVTISPGVASTLGEPTAEARRRSLRAR